MPNNKKYLVCNLKANFTKEELIKYEKELAIIPFSDKIELIICPSTPFLYIFDKETYKLGSQDISMYNNGPHTGENTAEQLASLNVKYALVGHSERRKLFKEEEKIIIEKIKKSYHGHIKPIYFIGETAEEKKYGITKQVLNKQLRNIIDEIPDYKREKLILVYEPLWSIGTGEIPTNQTIENTIELIKAIIKEEYGIIIPILYGGSIDEENISIISNISNIDGYVIGTSSKDINILNKIYNTITK